MKNLILLLSLIFSTNIFATENKSEILISEYTRIKEIIKTLKPDYKIGNFHNVKKYNGYVVVWDISEDEDREENELIRFYRDKGRYKGFAITYHRSTVIVDNRIVVRRFIGPEPYGFRNDTADYDTYEYLGRQGVKNPQIDDFELSILKQWGIKLFKD